MSKRQKRLDRLRRNLNNVSLEELQRVLEDYGFDYKRSVGSHCTFSYVLGGETKLFVVPFRRPLKPIYVKRALQIIDTMIELQGEDDADGDE